MNLVSCLEFGGEFGKNEVWGRALAKSEVKVEFIVALHEKGTTGA